MSDSPAAAPERLSPMEELFQKRLKRYTTAMRLGKPDCVPIRPFVAEFTATYAGYTCQEVTKDYNKAFLAARKCAADFDWDAVVSNMVYVWTGLTQAIGLKYFGIPGIHVPANNTFQYLEPSEEQAWMQPEDYDALIEDPVGFLFNIWLPRVSGDVVKPGEPATFRNNMSFLKGGMAMMQYFNAFGPQNEALRRESGTVPAICGMYKAPLDIIADKFRGYLGLISDLSERPEKVKKACEALTPHMVKVALGSADPAKNVPIGFWMHRGCVPFISHKQFEDLYWAFVKPAVEEIWRHGHQVLFYAEGKWLPHLKAFKQLPAGSIVFHCDRDDVFEVHKVLGGHFCISGGLSNYLLAFGTPDDVRRQVKKIVEEVGRDGAYIMDASAIMQQDSKIENVRAMTEATREYGVY